MSDDSNVIEHPRSRPRERGGPEDSSGLVDGGDFARRLREVERDVDRIPGEIRTQTATITGKLDVLNAKLESSFQNVATREWIMGRALWVYALIVGLVLSVVAIVVALAINAISTVEEPNPIVIQRQLSDPPPPQQGADESVADESPH